MKRKSKKKTAADQQRPVELRVSLPDAEVKTRIMHSLLVREIEVLKLVGQSGDVAVWNFTLTTHTHNKRKNIKRVNFTALKFVEKNHHMVVKDRQTDKVLNKKQLDRLYREVMKWATYARQAG